MPGTHSSPRPAERGTTAPAATAVDDLAVRRGARGRRPGLVTTASPHRLPRGTDRTRSR